MAVAPTDFQADFRFQLEIAEIQTAGFSEANVPGGNVEAAAYREGTDPGEQQRGHKGVRFI